MDDVKQKESGCEDQGPQVEGGDNGELTKSHLLVMGAVLHRVVDELNRLGGNYPTIMAARHICNVLMGHPYVSDDSWCEEFDKFVQKHFPSLATASTQPAKEDDSSTSEEDQEDDGSTEFKRQKDWQKEQLDKITAAGQEVK